MGRPRSRHCRGTADASSLAILIPPPDRALTILPALNDALAFIERSPQLTVKDTVDDFLATVKRIGFAAGACGAWAGVGRNRKVRFFFVDWPQDWLDYYQRNDCAEHDMMVIEARRRVSAFWYSGVVTRLKLTARQKQLYQDGIDYGWRDVFAIPIHGPGSMQGLVTLATRREMVLTPAESSVVEIMARNVWERCRTSEGFGMFEPSQVSFSPREVECLQWAAAGKSDNDIAAIIGISAATVHYHIERAKTRLGVKSRVEAVAVGVLCGVL